MNRQEKEAVVADLKQMMSNAQATFLINYKGMSVSLFQGLRKNVRQEGGKIRVAKANLMQIAAKDLPGSEAFSQTFKDQVGLVFAQKDVSALAKQLVNYAKNHETMKVVAGFYESRMLTQQDLNMLASLPSREVLLAQLCGTLQAPTASFVRVLHLLIARLVYVLKQVEEKQKAAQ
jgi:large subunit ribosomal protein L10